MIVYRLLPQHNHKAQGFSPLKCAGSVCESRARIQFGGSNLVFLLNKRLSWIPDLRDEKLLGVEFGSGAGITKLLIPGSKVISTDILHSSWLDIGGVDATSTVFPDATFDYIFINNVLHHLAKPNEFFKEAKRILKPSGRLYIQEIHTSLFMRLILKLTNHESYDSKTNALFQSEPLSDPDDPWDANCDIARQLFDNPSAFKEVHSGWQIIKDKKTEFLTFLNSGGVVVTAPHVPLPKLVSSLIWTIDSFLVKLFPNILGLQRQLVLVKTADC